MGRKAPISFGLIKYIEKHCNGPSSVQQNKVRCKKDFIVPDLIDFFGDDRKEIKKQILKRNIHICKKYCTDQKLVC